MIVHFLMCMVGGFLGSYALLLRGNFGSAQTANLIQLFIQFRYGDFFHIFLRIAACLLYITMLSAAFFLARWDRNKAKIICILLEAAGLILVGLIPKDVDDLTAVMPLFAITAFQWGNFNGVRGYSSPTLFSTGNLRNCTVSWLEYLSGETERLKRAIYFTETLCFYHIGVAAGIWLTDAYGAHSVWICMIPLMCSFLTILYEMNCKTNEGSICE